MDTGDIRIRRDAAGRAELGSCINTEHQPFNYTTVFTAILCSLIASVFMLSLK